MSDDRKPKTLAGGVGKAIRGAMANIHTVLLGVVDSYSETSGRANIVPCMGYGRMGPDLVRAVQMRATIPDVPVGFFGAAGGAIRMPLAKGDEVAVFVCEGSIATWKGKRGGKGIDPADDRRFDLSDAIAVPLVFHGTANLSITFTEAGTVDVGGPLDTFTSVPGPTDDRLVKATARDPFSGQPFDVTNPTELTEKLRSK